MLMRLAPALAAATLLLAAACSKSGEHATADSAALVKADSAGLAPPVGSDKPAMDSAVANGKATLDSLKQAGETPASGIAKGVQPAVHAAANDSSAKAHSLKVKPTNVP